MVSLYGRMVGKYSPFSSGRKEILQFSSPPYNQSYSNTNIDRLSPFRTMCIRTNIRTYNIHILNIFLFFNFSFCSCVIILQYTSDTNHRERLVAVDLFEIVDFVYEF